MKVSERKVVFWHPSMIRLVIESNKYSSLREFTKDWNRNTRTLQQVIVQRGTTYATNNTPDSKPYTRENTLP